MANIVIKDLEMDMELDNISLKQIVGGWYAVKASYKTSTAVAARTSVRAPGFALDRAFMAATNTSWNFAAMGSGRPLLGFAGNPRGMSFLSI